MKQKGSTGILVFTFLAVALVGYWGYTQYIPKQQDVPIPTLAPSPLTSPQPTAKSITPTGNWKTYTSPLLSFQYPADLTLNERQKNYIVLLVDPQNPSSVLVSVDARLANDYVLYDKAVAATKEGLTNIQTQDIPGGIKISGKIGPGFGQGQPVTLALFKYHEGAIEAETTATDAARLSMFDQILSTFTFTQ